MAESLRKSLLFLGIENTLLVGISQGGMIAQHLTLKAPNIIKKLALVVTLSKPNPVVNAVISNWLQMAERGGTLYDLALFKKVVAAYLDRTEIDLAVDIVRINVFHVSYYDVTEIRLNLKVLELCCPDFDVAGIGFKLHYCYV